MSGREGRRLSERFSLASDAVAQCWLGRMWVLRGCCWKIAVASIHHGFRTPSPRFRHNNNGGSFGSAIRGESRKQQRPGVLLSEKTQGGGHCDQLRPDTSSDRDVMRATLCSAGDRLIRLGRSVLVLISVRPSLILSNSSRRSLLHLYSRTVPNLNEQMRISRPQRQPLSGCAEGVIPSRPDGAQE